MVTFSHKNVLKFIKLVSEQRDLYDPNSPNYKSKNKRTKIWAEIATKCSKKGLTGNTCKNLWNKLKRSYFHYKKTGSVVTKRTFAKSKVYEKMTFLEVQKQQGNEKQPQGNKNQQNNNENQQQGNINQQQGNEKSQHGKENQQQGNAQQYAMSSVQLNISDSEVNLGSTSNEETPQSFHENLPVAKSKPQFFPQHRQNEDKPMADELYLFSTQVLTILGNLPCELQINAQEEVFQVLSKYKKLALSAGLSMSVSESSTNITTE